MNIGERQTVQRAKHPTLGEGRLVYDNGPAFFLADSGEVEHYKRTESGGCGSAESSRGRYSERIGIKPTGESVALDTLDRECGPQHERIVTEDGRPGWLVRWSDAVSKRERFWWHRFEPDTGEHEAMMIQEMWIGLAKDRNGKRSIEAMQPWRSLRSIGKHVFTYRHEGEPVPEAKPTRAPKKAAPRGPFPGPDATRAEIAAWKAGA